jgi:hypothetical protein
MLLCRSVCHLDHSQRFWLPELLGSENCALEGVAASQARRELEGLASGTVAACIQLTPLPRTHTPLGNPIRISNATQSCRLPIGQGCCMKGSFQRDGKLGCSGQLLIEVGYSFPFLLVH